MAQSVIFKKILCCSLTLYILTGLDKQNFQRKIVNIFLPIILSICFGCSEELSQ